MKTLVNKENPQIKILAPEIKWGDGDVVLLLRII